MTTRPPRAVDRRDHAVAADGVGQGLREGQIGCAAPERDDPAMICRAPAASTSRARSTLRMPPPTRHDKAPAICRNEREVVAVVHGGIEVDHLDLRELLEPPHPPEHILVADRELFALHQLDDGAAFEIDRGDQHQGQLKPRNARKKTFRHETHEKNSQPYWDAVLAEMRLERADGWCRRSGKSTRRARRRRGLR